MAELQVLGDELGVANRTFAQFDFTPGAPVGAQVGLGALLHTGHARAHLVRGGVEDQRLHLLHESGGQGFVAGNDTRFE